eukprot:ANDGO_04587.mRNA.1 hypothetical protein
MSVDGEYIFSGGDDGTVRVWLAKNGDSLEIQHVKSQYPASIRSAPTVGAFTEERSIYIRCKAARQMLTWGHYDS